MAVGLISGLGVQNIAPSQPVDVFSSLAPSIALANALKATLNTHYADAGTGTEEHILAYSAISAADAYDERTLIILVSAIQDSYDAHDADAELASAWVYHQAQEAGDASLASTTNPETLAECLTVLNDIKAKVNIHVADSTAHTAGDSGTESTADSTASFEIDNSFTDFTDVINVKGAKSVVLWVDYDRGDSTNMQIKALVGNTADACNHEFVIESDSSDKVEVDNEVVETGVDADLKFVRQFVLDRAINFIKFQVKDDADGTGQLDRVRISVGR